MPSKTAIVIGAGIVGLAMARSLAEGGYAVTVFERNAKAIGASIRNFGMIWPIGQPCVMLYHRALRSKEIWKHICEEAGLWFNETGSLHLGYDELELAVLGEFAEESKGIRPVKMMSRGDVSGRSEAANLKGLKGGLWCADEMVIESRVAIEKLPEYLYKKYAVRFHFNTAITGIDYPHVSSGNRQWSADEIFVCSGVDFETLYPEVFAANDFTKCKLQMMRLEAQPNGWRIGPSLCGGLSLIHYKSFEVAPSLPLLKEHYRKTMPEYLQWGIHVMVCQNGEGELTVGDSHEYGLVHDPFDKNFINKLIVEYLKGFAQFNNLQLQQSWNGIYSKQTGGQTEFIYSPQQGVTIINGLGGAGMTLSFGLAEELVASRLTVAHKMQRTVSS